jgi:7,8-dihydro-6-hydroxymethylpterin-pyrophosphokinase
LEATGGRKASVRRQRRLDIDALLYNQEWISKSLMFYQTHNHLLHPIILKDGGVK